MLRKVLRESLHEQQYSSESARQLSKEIGETVKARLKGTPLPSIMHMQSCCYGRDIYNVGCMCFAAELELDRYKYVVQVVIGEQRGEGVK